MLATDTSVETYLPADLVCAVSDDAHPGLNDRPWTLERTLDHDLHVEYMAWKECAEEKRERSPNWVRLLEWERNGPSDSDWYSIVMHRGTGVLLQIETGTTRFANALHTFTGFFSPLTDSDLSKAARTWAEMSARFLVGMDTIQVLTPEPFMFKAPGAEVALLRKAHVEVRQTEPCRKCNGSGKYTGRREGTCYPCSGLGFHMTKKAKASATDTTTKPTKVKIDAGTRATTLAPSEAWGTFYKDGYNKPNRSNSRVLCKLESGEVVFLSLDALRLSRDPITFEDKLVETTQWAARLYLGDERWAAPFGVRVF